MDAAPPPEDDFAPYPLFQKLALKESNLLLALLNAQSTASNVTPTALNLLPSGTVFDKVPGLQATVFHEALARVAAIREEIAVTQRLMRDVLGLVDGDVTEEEGGRMLKRVGLGERVYATVGDDGVDHQGKVLGLLCLTGAG